MLPVETIAARFHGRTAGSSTCFWTRAGRAYRDAVAELEQLRGPSHATSRTQVSANDVQRQCDRILRGHPHNVDALWAALGVSIYYCSNELDDVVWRRLFDLDEFDPAWLVEHAHWVELVSGKQTAPLLAALLHKHALRDAVMPTLLALRSYNPPHSEHWVAEVLAARG